MSNLDVTYFINNDEVYLNTAQPTSCPICGSRTEILFEWHVRPEYRQQHKCLDSSCCFEFFTEKDNDI